jgi:hypothetical protein
MSELGQKDLPRAIPAERLQAMLGANPAFCSGDALNSAAQKLTAARWPFLFYPFMAINRKRSAP